MQRNFFYVLVGSAVFAALSSCGGTVETGSTGGGAGAGTGGSTNTGGKGGASGKGGAGGSSGIGGAGGTVATGGTGGYGGYSGGWDGGGGGPGGTGGYGGYSGGWDGGGGGPGGTGGSACPPVASCNWCAGSTNYDPWGCIVGFTCKNGVDPCVTKPCQVSTDCPPNSTCGPDMLCWPSSTVTCSNKSCGGSSTGDCSCKWQCTDNNTYSFDCKINPGGTSCTCYTNGNPSSACTSGGGGAGGAGACDNGAQCCPFPN